MRDYFESELRLLNEYAQEFSEAYPEQAGMLNLSEVKDRDPYVERLLEGMAFLTAQIRQQIDDDIPEISETLLNQIKPDFLRPFPSCTIIEFIPRSGQLQKSQKLNKGQVLISNTIGDDNTTCKFTSTSNVEMYPLSINNVSLEDNPLGGSQLTLKLKTESGIDFSDLNINNLKVYIHSDPSIALWVFHQVCSELISVCFNFNSSPTNRSFTFTEQESITPCHLGVEDSLTDSNGHGFFGFNLLQDLFCFREKYLFFNINIFGLLYPFPVCNELSIKINVKGTMPIDHSISNDSFKLFCSPAVNIYDSVSEPITVTNKRTSYPVYADVNKPIGIHVYSVIDVVGINSKTGERSQFYPMSKFKYKDNKSRYFNEFKNCFKSLKTNTHVFISESSFYNDEVLSCNIKATNGAYPRRYLKENSIIYPGSGFPSFASFTNITRPSNFLRVPDRKYYQWDLISNLSLNITSLNSVGNLIDLLTLYNWSNDKQNVQRINGIKNINIHTKERISRGALMRGLVIQLSLDEVKYRSNSDIWLFGLILHNFFSMYTSINCFIETEITTFPTNKEYKWKPIQGKNIPI